MTCDSTCFLFVENSVMKNLISVLIRRSFGMLYQFLYKSVFGNFIENISP